MPLKQVNKIRRYPVVIGMYAIIEPLNYAFIIIQLMHNYLNRSMLQQAKNLKARRAVVN